MCNRTIKRRGPEDRESDYSFLASFAFGRSSLLPHLRQRVARIAFRA